MMAFNDVYFFKMDKAIQNIHHYEKVWSFFVLNIFRYTSDANQ